MAGWPITGKTSNGSAGCRRLRMRRSRISIWSNSSRRFSCGRGTARRGHVRGAPSRRGGERARRARGGWDRRGGGARCADPGRSRLRRRVAAGRAPVVLDDVDHADVLNPILREKGIKSLLGVPLLARDEVIGVLHVGCLSHRNFTPDDVELLQLAADRAALAIDHARAFEAERRARQRIEHVQAVMDAALAPLELDELLTVLLPRIRSILNADTCAVLLLDEEANELVARAAVGIEEEVEQGVRIPVGRGFAGKVAAGRAPVILDDVDHADVLNPILREKGIKSLLGVPLLVRDEVIGVLHVGCLSHRNFTRDDIELLELVARASRWRSSGRDCTMRSACSTG